MRLEFLTSFHLNEPSKYKRRGREQNDDADDCSQMVLCAVRQERQEKRGQQQHEHNPLGTCKEEVKDGRVSESLTRVCSSTGHDPESRIEPSAHTP